MSIRFYEDVFKTPNTLSWPLKIRRPVEQLKKVRGELRAAIWVGQAVLGFLGQQSRDPGCFMILVGLGDF